MTRRLGCGAGCSAAAAAAEAASRACVRGVVVEVTASDVDEDEEGGAAPAPPLDGVPGRMYGTSGGISDGSASGGTAGALRRPERVADAGDAAAAEVVVVGAAEAAAGAATAAPRLRLLPETEGD